MNLAKKKAKNEEREVQKKKNKEKGKKKKKISIMKKYVLLPRDTRIVVPMLVNALVSFVKTVKSDLPHYDGYLFI